MSTAITPIAAGVTNVTATLVDANASLWTNARVVITFVAPPNTSGPYLANGQPFQLKWRFDNIGSSGSFSVDLPSNIDITPEGNRSFWRFDIGPNWDDNTSVSFLVQVAGPTMDLSQTFTFVSAQLIISSVQSMPVPRAADDLDVITAPNDGQIFYNSSEQVMKFWANDIWNSFGGTGEQGPIGPTGPQGATGPQGVQGPPGNTGPTGPTGPKGDTGSSVTILGSYNTYEELIAAHPTGNLGDGWLVGPDLYVWNGTAWENVGQIQGPQGEVGPMGPQGIQGNPGTTGQAGATGPQGPPGQTGPTGQTGPQGPIGNTGPQGSIGPPGPTIYPGTGVAVSTGSAWSTSIDPATLARTNTNNNFSVAQIINADTFTFGNVYASPNNSINPIGAGNFGIALGWNVRGQNESDFVNYNNGGLGGYNWYIVLPETTVTSTSTPVMALNSNGTLSIGSNIRLGARSPLSQWESGSANINADLNLALNATATGAIYLNYDQCPGGVNFCDGAGSTVAAIAGTGHAIFNGAIYSSGTNGNLNGSYVGGIAQSNTVCFFDSVGDASNLGMFIWRVAETNGVNSVSIGQFTSGGFYANGTISSGGAKTFRINHPLKKDKELVHACVEGPEAAVFYRGEAATRDGVVVIELPDYFEILTRPEGRTVQLTQIVEDEDEAFIFAQLAAGRIKDGKFRVFSTFNTKFYWEVKAVRADIPELEVESDITIVG